MDVLTAAWLGAGAPARLPAGPAGQCARCAATGPLTPTRRAVSASFTGYDSWAHPAGGGLCPPCAWAYTTLSLRRVPHLVRRSPATLTPVSGPDVAALLRTGPLSSDLAVVVPLRPGRKHLLPAATWGQVTVDDARLSWTDADARRLHAVTRLRAQGFGTRMLTAPAPPFRVLHQLPASAWPAVAADWAALTPWRVPPGPWLALALHVTVA